MIIVLNGYPGVGKTTIGQALASRLGGRLLDIHSIYNVAFALHDIHTPPFRRTVERVERVAHDEILGLPGEVPVVLTTVLAGNKDWGREEWARIEALGAARPPLCVVHVACNLDENIRRITSPARDGMRKPRDPDMVRRNHAGALPLAGLGAERLLKLDVTGLGAEDAARHIADWAAPPAA